MQIKSRFLKEAISYSLKMFYVDLQEWLVDVLRYSLHPAYSSRKVS